jgi:NAD(P)H-hydrate epimerase
VETWLVDAAAGVRGDAATNLEALRRLGLAPRAVDDPGGLQALARGLAAADLVVDGLLGIGVRGPATGLIAQAIAALNDAGRPVCALDLPSGLSPDRSGIPGPAVRASLTVTFGLPKLALYLAPASGCCGRVEVADLGVPPAWLARDVAATLLDARQVGALLPVRPVEAHKGRYGHLLVVAGSRGKTGAAALVCLGALGSGAGLVTAALPASQQAVVAARVAEAMTEALPETADGSAAGAARARLVELAQRMDAVVLGPGSGLGDETRGLLRALARELPRPMVVDADGLTALAGHLEDLRGARGPRLLTPHPGEAARLLDRSVAEVQDDRAGSARELAAATGAHVALKGAGTVVAGPAGELWVNPTGNPAMATGGTGDVLAGVAGSLLAQGLAPAAALTAAVYLHGLAGDLAAGARGPAGLLAGDLAGALPAAIARVTAPA